MKHGGKLAILTILFVATALGSFGWVWHALQGRRALEAWGSGSGMLIRHAPTVELLRLSADKPAGENADGGGPISIGDRKLWVVEQKNITGAKDLKYYRQALIDDYAYRWDARPGDCEPGWSYALRFSDGNQEAMLAFDFACGTARLQSSGREVPLEAVTAEKLESFLARQFEQAKPVAPGEAAEKKPD